MTRGTSSISLWTTIITMENGFSIRHVVEPPPPEDMMDLPGMRDEMRRPMMLLVCAEKRGDCLR